jgi:hypothetical protein
LVEPAVSFYILRRYLDWPPAWRGKYGYPIRRRLFFLSFQLANCRLPEITIAASNLTHTISISVRGFMSLRGDSESTGLVCLSLLQCYSSSKTDQAFGVNMRSVVHFQKA